MSSAGNRIPVLFATDDAPLYEQMQVWLPSSRLANRTCDIVADMRAEPPKISSALLRDYRPRFASTRRAFLFASPSARREGADGWSALHAALFVLLEVGAEFVIANADGSTGDCVDGIPHMMRGVGTKLTFVANEASAIEAALLRRLAPKRAT